MTKLPFFFAVIVFVPLFSTPTLAEIKSITISDDSRPIIIFEKFRFTQTGHVTVSVSSVSVSSPSSSPILDSSRLGFFFLTKESILQVLFLELKQNPRFCVLDSHYLLNLFTLRNQTQSFSITSPNEYTLFFANCVAETSVSMKIKTEMYNLDLNGSKVYLQPKSTRLPGLYLFFSLSNFTFFFTTLCFYYLCYKKKKQIIRRIHILMVALLLVKSLTLFCAGEVKRNVKVTGTAHGWNVLFYVFEFVGEILLFAVIVVIGISWSFLKQKKLLMIVVPFKILANIASIVIEETGPFIEDWVIWNQIFLLADMISCCAVVWSICRRGRSKTDEKAVKNLPRFRIFNVLVIVYFLFTRIVGFALKIDAGYEYQLMSNAAKEIASLVFWVLMFYMFRPMERNEYFGVDDDLEEEETRELALKKEEVES